MKKNVIHTAIAMTFATSLFSACTHMETQPIDGSDDMDLAGNQPVANHAAAMQNQKTPITVPSASHLSNMDCGSENPMAGNSHYFNKNGKKSTAIKIRVTGYGAPPKSFYPDPQRRLMAMRAAKIDAYRSLAERVSGLQIWGGTTIGDMVVEKDRFRVYLDTHLTGAKVITESGQEDGTYETVVELKVDQPFLQQTLPPKKTSLDCQEMQHTPMDLGNAKQARTTHKNNISKAGFYFQED